MTSETSGPAERGGLYVHVPFCQSKCPYCDFYSVTEDPGEDWVDAILAEARQQADRFRELDTLYLGGGTPSTLPPALTDRLFRGLWDSVNFNRNAELTIEVNPDDVTGDRLDRWLKLGIDRWSLGVQSFAEDELFLLGRRHSAEQTRTALELVRSAGVTNLSLDLIFGLPGRTAERWRRTLEQALELQPEHLSCYQLTLAPATPFGKAAASGELALPDEELGRELFLATIETLGAAGYDHYEISNFARNKELRSRHNLKYWSHAPVLGLGPGAHSFRSGDRWWNVRSVSGYIEALCAGKSPREGSETLTANQLLLEQLMLGFRTSDGVGLATLGQIPGWRSTLSRLVDEGLLTVDGERARPTVEGYLLADGLPLSFGV